MWAMVLKEFRQMRRDRRALALSVAVPLLMLVVFGYAASFDVTDVATRVHGAGAPAVVDRLPDRLEVVGIDEDAGEDLAHEILRDGDAVVVVVTSAGDPPRVLVDGSQLFAARSVVSGLAGAASGMEVEVRFNPGLETAVVMIPAIAGMILVFVGTVITSLGMVRERAAGTLEQLTVMPFRARDVMAGKIAPYFVIAAVDMAIVVIVGVVMFDVPFRGSVLLFALGSALFLLVTLGIGLLVSSVSQNSGQAIQLALMTLLPQVLLSGMIFPLDAMAAGVRWISWGLPLTYFIDIARAVMVRGGGLDAVAEPLVLLAGLGAAVFGLALTRFSRDLAPSRATEHVVPREVGA